MADHKRQHYVPRCHLRPFSVDEGGAAINLYNISRLRSVGNASVRGQCAKDYFYGSDLQLESALQVIEREYARIIRGLEVTTNQTTQQDLDVLRTFAYLQYSRTDMAMRRMRIMQERMHNAIYDGRPVTPPDLDLSDRTMMHFSMLMYFQTRQYIDDLKVCVIENETASDFVTSDDPAIFTSRYYVQRLRSRTYGTASSGALLFLPLTPRLALMCYDGGVYAIPHKRGWRVKTKEQSDIFALNMLQYLKASENIYFSRWTDRSRVEKEFLLIAPQRPHSWCSLSIFVPDGATEHETRYRRATEAERTTASHTMMAMSTIHPAPSRWISKLKFRDPVLTYANGTAIGHVRKAAWLDGDRNSQPSSLWR